MDNREHRIADIKPGSIAAEMGIETGDILISINDSSLQDIIDYMDLTSEPYLEVAIRKPDGEEWILEIDKEPEEDLGIVFENPLLDRQRSCGNNCVFCFIDQLPQKMRETVYYKDDDWRLSFLMGNYITLTNLSEKDVNRIIKKHISPLYISVHTTNPELRKRMLGNKRAGDVYSILKKFNEAGIQIHAQIVLCPGWNDGSELDRTLGDLWGLRNSIRSAAVVPVGLTGHREGLEPIGPFDGSSANQVIEQVYGWQRKCLSESDTAFVFAADEFYILARKEFPDYEAYEEFPQLENGVGLAARFRQEFEEELETLGDEAMISRSLSVFTGVSAYEIIKDLINKVPVESQGNVKVYSIPSLFFGGQVTVSGLVTGQDIIRSVSEKPLGERVLIPSVMLRKGEDVFLDDTRLEDLEIQLRTAVQVVSVDGRALLRALVEKQ